MPLIESYFPLLLHGLLVGAVLFSVLWLVQTGRNNAAVFDIGLVAGLGWMGLAAGSVGLGWQPRRTALAMMVGFWCARRALRMLGGTHFAGAEPERYGRLRRRFGHHANAVFFPIGLAYALCVTLVGMAFIPIIDRTRIGFGPSDVLAVLVWFAALIGVSVAERRQEQPKAVLAMAGKAGRQPGTPRRTDNLVWLFEGLHACSYVVMGLTAPGGVLTLLAPLAVVLFMLRLPRDRLRAVNCPKAALAGILACMAVATLGDDADAWEASSNRWPIWRADAALSGKSPAGLTPPLRERWRVKLGDGVKGSAVIADGRVFIGADDGNLSALSVKDGRLLWHRALDNAIEASPLLLADRVIVGDLDGILHALCPATGSTLWRYRTGGRITGSANCLVLPDIDPWIVVGSHDNEVHAVDAITGQERWRYATGSFINGTPALWGDRIVVGGCDARVHVIAAVDGKLERMIDVGAHIAGSVSLAQERVFSAHYGGEVLAMNPADGSTLWRYVPEFGDAPFFASPALAHGLVVVGGRDRRLHAMDASSGAALWSFTTRRPIDGSAVIAADIVWFGGLDGRLYALRLEDGEGLWEADLGGGIPGSPAIVDGLLVAVTDEGHVVAFEEARP